MLANHRCASDRVWGVSLILEGRELSLQNFSTEDHIVGVVVSRLRHQITWRDNLVVFQETFSEVLLEMVLIVLWGSKASEGRLEGAHATALVLQTVACGRPTQHCCEVAFLAGQFCRFLDFLSRFCMRHSR